MNSRYNIGKVLYKVDSYVDRSQETIYTQNIISDNQIVKDELTIGEGSDDSIVKISQSTNPSTGELEGNIETPNIKITKELKFEGDNNTTIDNSGINADTIYVNNLYTDNYNPTNLRTQNITIVDEHDQETGTKITKDSIEANTIKAQDLDVENLNIDKLIFKNEQETITTTITKDGITINNTNNNKNIGLNSDGEFFIDNKAINDIIQATSITYQDRDNLLTTQGYVDQAINSAITGGLETIAVNTIQSKSQDHIDINTDIFLRDSNNNYDVIAGNVIGTYKSEYSDNPKVLINNTNGITLTNTDTNSNISLNDNGITLTNSRITLTNTNSNISLNDNGITLNGTTIKNIATSDTQGVTNDTIPTTKKVNDMIEAHVPDLSDYARKDQDNEFTENNTFKDGTITFNNGLTTSGIKMGETTITSITTGPSDSDNTSIPTTGKVEELISDNLTNYVQKTGDNEISGNNTFTKNNYFNNGISTSNNNNLVLTSSSNIIEFGSKNTKSNITTASNKDTLTIDNIKVSNISNDNSQLTLLTTTITNTNNEDTLTTNNIIATNYQINQFTSRSKNMNKVSDDVSDTTTIKDTTFSTEAYVDKKLNDFQLIGNYQSIEGNKPNVKITDSDGIISSNYKSSPENPSVVITNNGITTNKIDSNIYNIPTTISSKDINYVSIDYNNPSTNKNITLATEAYVDNAISGGESDLIGKYKSDNPSNQNLPKVEINSTDGIKVSNGTTSTLTISTNGNITTTGNITTNTITTSSDNLILNPSSASLELQGNHTIITNNNNLTLEPSTHIVEINNTLKTDNINSLSNNPTLNISVLNSYPGSEQIQDTNEYAINLGHNTNLKTKQIQEDNKYVYKDTFKTDNLEAEELIIKEIEVLPGGIFSQQPIEVGDITNNNNNDQKTPYAGLYPSGEIKLLNGNNDLVNIYSDSNKSYGIIDIINNNNNTETTIKLDGNDGTITTKKINLPMKTNGNKTIIKVSDDITSSQTTEDTILSTEAYVDYQFTKGTNTFIGTYNSATSNSNITIDNTNGITTKYSINEPNIVTLDSSITTYKGITYNFNTNTNTATVTGINMTNEQSIIIPRYIIKGSTYYKINNINLSSKTYADNGYIYIPDTIEFISSANIDSLLNDTHKVLINMPINLYCSYLNELSQSNTYTHIIILRENKQSTISNINNNSHTSGCFIINLSSIKSIYLEKEKTNITTLFNEYASFNPDIFKNMPSEHYDILSNLEKDINDKLIKEYNKKMVYLKNGLTTSSLPDGASQDIISYNPYYNETKGGNAQVFNTELNNVIVNTGTNFKYKYNFQSDDIPIPDSQIIETDFTDYTLQHSFVMNETLYGISLKKTEQTTYDIYITSLWSFNPNVKINEEIFTGINLLSVYSQYYYCMYIYPYVIICCRTDGNNTILYYSSNLLYWQSIILQGSIIIDEHNNPIPPIYYINNKNILNDDENLNNETLNVKYTKENIVIFNLLNQSHKIYYIYPSYTKEELFMRM